MCLLLCPAIDRGCGNSLTAMYEHIMRGHPHTLRMRTAHKVCVAGEWISAAGTATSDRKCEACPDGRFRSAGPSGTAAEIVSDVCSLHRTCEAGEWTAAEGDATTDTTCTACSTGFFRASAPETLAKVPTWATTSVEVAVHTPSAHKWTQLTRPP